MTIEKDKRGCHSNRPKRIAEVTKQSVRDHINTIPRMESHYCRARTNKEYFEEGLNLRTLYDMYVQWMQIERPDIIKGKEHLYREIFNYEFNIEFFVPKNDQCDICTVFNNLPESEKQNRQEEFDHHIIQKNKAREIMRSDIEKGKEDPTIYVACFDLQKTLTTPKSHAGAMYYKRKLNIYNETVFDMVNCDGICNVWDETIAGKGANEVASIMFFIISDKVKENITEFIFYADNCSAQNKNKMLFSMSLMLSKKHNIKITYR